jgi:hypothetical protein
MDRNRASKRENIDNLKKKNPLCKTDPKLITQAYIALSHMHVVPSIQD